MIIIRNEKIGDTKAALQALMEEIRVKADNVLERFQSLFDVPEGMEFKIFFENQVAAFRNATKDLDQNKVFNLVTDPTIAG